MTPMIKALIAALVVGISFRIFFDLSDNDSLKYVIAWVGGVTGCIAFEHFCNYGETKRPPF